MYYELERIFEFFLNPFFFNFFKLHVCFCHAFAVLFLMIYPLLSQADNLPTASEMGMTKLFQHVAFFPIVKAYVCSPDSYHLVHCRFTHFLCILYSLAGMVGSIHIYTLAIPSFDSHRPLVSLAELPFLVFSLCFIVNVLKPSGQVLVRCYEYTYIY